MCCVLDLWCRYCYDVRVIFVADVTNAERTLHVSSANIIQAPFYLDDVSLSVSYLLNIVAYQ